MKGKARTNPQGNRPSRFPQTQQPDPYHCPDVYRYSYTYRYGWW